MQEQKTELTLTPLGEDHYKTIHGLLFKSMRQKALPFQPHVINWIMACRTLDNGLPSFRTKYAKTPFKTDNRLYVKAVCYLGKNIIKSADFKDVPPEDFKHLEENHDDYIYLLRKYAPELIEKAVKAPIVKSPV